jgi:hypothetical protein
MNITAKSVLLPFLLLALAIFNIPRASAGDGPETPDKLCDYCKDYTDAATATDPVRSTFRPGTGYGLEAGRERGREDEQARKDSDPQEHGIVSQAHASDKAHH